MLLAVLRKCILFGFSRVSVSTALCVPHAGSLVPRPNGKPWLAKCQANSASQDFDAAATTNRTRQQTILEVTNNKPLDYSKLKTLDNRNFDFDIINETKRKSDHEDGNQKNAATMGS